MQQPTFDTFIIKNWTLFESLQKYEQAVDSDIIVLDTETDNKEEKLANLFGISLCFNANKAFYIPWRKPDKSFYWSEDQMNIISNWIYNSTIKRSLIGYNIIYDILVINKNLGYDLTDYIHADPILMRHLIDEDGLFGLKDVAVQIFGDWANQEQQKLKEEVLAAGGKWLKDQKDMWMASTETLGTYSTWDVILTLMLYEHFDKKLDEEELRELFEVETMPLYKLVTIPMKMNGFPINLRHFQQLQRDLINEIDSLENDIYSLIEKDIKSFENKLLNEEFPVKNTGNFPKAMSEILGLPLPLNKKTNKITLSSKAILEQKKVAGNYIAFYNWLLDEHSIDVNSSTFKALYTKTGNIVKDTQMKLWKNKYESDRVFNLKSNDHLTELIVNVWGFNTLEKTPGGKPKIDDDFLETLKGNPVIDKLIIYKKLNKLLSTYVEGILDRQIDGIIYTSMLQFGTTSGRYASRNPNLQNLPRPKEESGEEDIVLKYTNMIREGFAVPEHLRIIDADYEALEPKCFAEMSGEKKLQDVFINGEDLYSRVGIELYSLDNTSAFKKDVNFLGNLHPEIRQICKVIALAIVYGAEASRISGILGIDYRSAQDIIDKYLASFPNLKKYMNKCNYQAKTSGKVKTIFGRIRHLPEARSINALYGDNILDYKYSKKHGLEDIRRKYKNILNLAKNHPIQGLAAHIINRSMIEIAKEYKRKGMKAYIGLMIHDQVVSVAPKEEAEEVKRIMQYHMENTIKLSVPLKAEPKIAMNLKESH